MLLLLRPGCCWLLTLGRCYLLRALTYGDCIGGAQLRPGYACALCGVQEVELESLREQLRALGGRSAAKREAELLDALELVTAKHAEVAKTARAREEQAKQLSKELSQCRAHADDAGDELRLLQRQLEDPVGLEAKLQQLLKTQLPGGRALAYGGEARSGAVSFSAAAAASRPFSASAPTGGSELAMAEADAAAEAAAGGSAAQPQWLWKLAALAWAVTAAAMAVACVALAASLVRSERLAVELQQARSETALARHLRLMDAVRSAAEAAEAAGEAAGPLSGRVCEKLCPALRLNAGDGDISGGGGDHGLHVPHHAGLGGHGHVAGGHEDRSTPRSRLVAASLALSLLLGPWFALRFCDSMPFLRGGSPHPPSKRFGYNLDNWFSTNRNSKPLALLAVTGAHPAPPVSPGLPFRSPWPGAWHQLGAAPCWLPECGFPRGHCLAAMLVAVGTSALFAASGGTIYDEAWTAVAGVGLDWTFAGDEDRSALERTVALFVSLGGMLVTALMLGIVSDTIGERMDELRKGRSEARQPLRPRWLPACAAAQRCSLRIPA